MRLPLTPAAIAKRMKDGSLRADQSIAASRRGLVDYLEQPWRDRGRRVGLKLNDRPSSRTNLSLESDQNAYVALSPFQGLRHHPSA